MQRAIIDFFQFPLSQQLHRQGRAPVEENSSHHIREDCESLEISSFSSHGLNIFNGRGAFPLFKRILVRECQSERHLGNRQVENVGFSVHKAIGRQMREIAHFPLLFPQLNRKLKKHQNRKKTFV